MDPIIEGLTIWDDCINDEYHDKLLRFIDQGKWDHRLSRAVQHYGYLYDYKSRDATQKADPLPNWANELLQFLDKHGLIDEHHIYPYNQLIVNEYKEGQGIGRHTDAKIFGDHIFTLSLGSPCKMIFAQRDRTLPEHVTLKPKMFVKMEGEARYKWTHEIPKITEGRRVSLTFRHVPE